MTNKNDLISASAGVPRRGLTLVEVLAVVIILGLIATTLTLSFRGQVGRAKHELAKTGISVIVNAVETYALEQGSLPTMDEGLDPLMTTPAGRSEPYLKRDQLRDPWGNQYIYVTPGENTSYEVISYGADGALGGEGEAADVSSAALGDDGDAG